MGDAAVQRHHVELDGVLVKRDVLVNVEDHGERQVTVGVDVAPGDDRTVDEGLVVRLNDDVEHAAHAQVQAVVSVNGACNGHLPLGQQLLSVVNVK